MTDGPAALGGDETGQSRVRAPAARRGGAVYHCCYEHNYRIRVPEGATAEVRANCRRRRCCLVRAYRDEQRNADVREDGSIWRDVALCQFHDVLPGSSIREAHADAERLHGLCESELLALRAAAAAACGGQVWNTLGWERREVVSLGLGGAAAGEELAMVVAPAYGVGAAIAVPDAEHVMVSTVAGARSLPLCVRLLRFCCGVGGRNNHIPEGTPADGIVLENALMRAVVSTATGQLTR